MQTLRLLGAFELPEAGLYRTYADDIAGSRGNWTLDDVDRVLDRYDSALKELDRAHRHPLRRSSLVTRTSRISSNVTVAVYTSGEPSMASCL